ncbi:hypothetical protein Tco_0186863, partial [Tanacetum coccineum]
YKTSAFICIIKEEYFDKYGRNFIGIDSVVAVIWTGLYLKIDGFFKHKFIYEDMTRNLLLNYWYEIDYGFVHCWSVDMEHLGKGLCNGISEEGSLLDGFDFGLVIFCL